MRELKYTASYLIPLLTYVAIFWQGAWSYSTFIFAFVLVPFAESFTPQSQSNLDPNHSKELVKNKFFDWLLYANLPLTYGIIASLLFVLNTSSLAIYEWAGVILSAGIALGACGINVAHELGHRKNRTERLLAKLLLVPTLYTHWFVEHNRGHHKYVATPLDPATARFNENLYFFWFRSIVGTWISAWQLEKDRLKRLNLQTWSLDNEILSWLAVTLIYILSIFFLSRDVSVFLSILSAGIIGVLLLETINYIEHYGLLRKKLEDGRYERVRPQHSWNSNHEIGRIILYELTRHSDHHYIASKKYQILDHHDQSPQLPLGYPGSMLMALVPPLWFSIMNPRVKKHAQEKILATESI